MERDGCGCGPCRARFGVGADIGIHTARTQHAVKPDLQTAGPHDIGRHGKGGTGCNGGGTRAGRGQQDG